MLSIIILLIVLCALAFVKPKKVVIVQPVANHDGKKIELKKGDRVRVKGVGDGVVDRFGNFRVYVKFDNNGKIKPFFKSKIIRI